MGPFSSTGLASGLPTGELIDQLMELEARPRKLVERRVGVLQAKKGALLEVNARLLAMTRSSEALADTDDFRLRSASSSNDSVLVASASKKATVGNYQIFVDRLATTHQMVTSGFADKTSPVGAGMMSFETARGRLDQRVRLSDLNGGQGVQRGKIEILDRSGKKAVIDLSRAVDLDDVVKAINEQSDISVNVSVEGDRLKLTDTSGGTANDLTVTEIGSTQTAKQLGLLGNSGGTTTITGDQIHLLSNQTTLASLNDGNGIRETKGLDDFQVALADGTTFSVNLDDTANIEDVIDQINTAAGSDLTASIGSDGVSLKLTDHTVGGNTFEVTTLNSSKAAADLGILKTGSGGVVDGDRLIATLGSKLLKNLNGGSGMTGNTLSVTDRDGNATNIDLSSAQTVSEVIDLINGASAGVTASLNQSGNGFKLTDTTGGSQNLIVAGDAASGLGLATDPAGVAANQVAGTNVNVAYITESTLLSSLNGGEGIAKGNFKITDAQGATATVDLSEGDEKTIEDVIKEINSRPIDVTASINSTGDGILLTDTSGGSGMLKVEEAGSSTAADLGLLGMDEDQDGKLDGSFEIKVTIDSDDTLEDVVEKIADSGAKVTALIINDGSATTPYRLSLTSTQSGEGGRIVFDDGDLGLSTTTLSEGHDAVALLGSSDPASALLLTSATNTIKEAIADVDLTLKSTSDKAVQVSVVRDTSSLVNNVQTFVTAFNELINVFEKHDSYDQDTKERGILLGDATVQTVRRKLFKTLNSRIDVAGPFQYLSQIGLKIKTGSELELDEEAFGKALEENPNAVADLFTSTKTVAGNDFGLPDGVTVPESSDKDKPVGFGKVVEEILKNLTDDVDGTIKLRTDSLDTQIGSSKKRISELTKLIGLKRDRLTQEFAAMETAISKMQQQGGAIANLGALAQQMRSSG